MARIRTIKPEFWISEQIAECSPTARLLFVGLWNFADDGGVHPASVRRLKMEVFPGDEFSLDEMRGWISELLENGLLVEFEDVEGVRYWQVTGWHHQKIDRPKYKYPQFSDNSTTVRRSFDDHSSSERRKEGKGREGKGKEGSTSPVVEASTTGPDDVAFFPVNANGGEEWGLSESLRDELVDAYPGVDVEAELRAARAWCVANPTNRKTPRGMPKFLNSWMARCQNKTRAGPADKPKIDLKELTEF